MRTRRWVPLVLLLVLLSPHLRAADEKPAIPSQDLRAGKDANKRYFLLGPRKGAKAPKAGFGLVLVLPGGAGKADFAPFVRRLARDAIPPGYLVAQLVAVKWNDEQEVTWPTARNRVKKMKFTTEQFVKAVIDDVGARHKIDPKKVFTLSWSSGGPAAYAVALSVPKVTGSFIAMSVFVPARLPPLKKAKGHAFYLYHSPEDRVCRYFFARKAVKDLGGAGAAVELATYEGGHGWRSADIDGDVRKGIRWLEKKAAARKR
jgi:predicted esterase